MPSLRKRVSSYFRQLSFHNEPRDKRHNINENSFVTKYLQGHITLREGPPIIYGKNPTDLPNYELAEYETSYGSIVGCYSGPKGGLTTVKRIEKHLSVLDPDIDFIDTVAQEPVEKVLPPKKSPQRLKGQPVDNTTMIIKVAGQEYCVTNRTKKHNKSHSLGSISDFDLEIETTKIDKEFYNNSTSHHESAVTSNNNNSIEVSCKNSIGIETAAEKTENDCDNADHSSKGNVGNCARKKSSDRQSYSLAKSKSEGNPFRHNKRGKIIRVAQRPTSTRDNGGTEPEEGASITIDDSALPREWSRKSDLVYGISDSLYDRNQVTNNKNGDPIADCFGVISRTDSAILAVADGVNWGEKASIAAKSAVHGCLHYLNKTVFNDIKPFENLTVKSDETSDGYSCETPLATHRVANTREIFVCLLRAFNCAHDLILENQGMLTTLTVAVVLPLKPRIRREEADGSGVERRREVQYVCCVCNVGDTLAYVYSQKHGLRELTKGSHDINCNRDMRDALGALGPVDGINPELSNLTLSITTLQKGDIVMVASDGLTDNFDPNVCRFTVNTHVADSSKVRKPTTSRTKPVQHHLQQHQEHHHKTPSQTKPPIKPPRRSHANKGSRAGSVTSDSGSVSDRGSRAGSVTSDTVTTTATITEAPSPKPPETDCESDPLKAHFIRENQVDKKKPTVVETKTSSLRRQVSSQNRQQVPPSRLTQSTKKPEPVQGYKFLRSKTTIDMRPSSPKQILRNEDGIPYVTPVQRYELQLLLIEDVLKNGISGRESPCTTARKLCENLVSFTFSITSAKRHTLEDFEMYFDNRNGLMVEVSQQEKKIRRKRGLEKVQNLPGKLDHVSVVAWNVGNFNF